PLVSGQRVKGLRVAPARRAALGAVAANWKSGDEEDGTTQPPYLRDDEPPLIATSRCPASGRAGRGDRGRDRGYPAVLPPRPAVAMGGADAAARGVRRQGGSRARHKEAPRCCAGP